MAEKKKSVKVTEPKTGRKTGTLVPQKHGGAILNGMAKNHVPGPGRPPDKVKAKLRELGFNKAVPFLSRTLDGKLSVSLLGKCDACQHEQQISEEWVELIMNRITTSTDHQLKASDQVLKYGKPDKDLVIASSEAAAFFDCVHAAIAELYGEQAAEAVKVRAIQLIEAKA